MSIFTKGIISKALASTGTFLLMLSGQSQALPDRSHEVAKGSTGDDVLRARANDQIVGAPGPDGRRVTVDKVENDGRVHLAAHANSGPTTHSNVPGHANFAGNKMNPGELRMQPGQMKVQPQQMERYQVKPGGGAAAAHANSGPTTHSNVPGHANFADKVQNPAEIRVQPGRIHR